VVITTWLQFKVSTPQTPPSEDGKPNAAAATQQTMGTVMPLMYGFFALSFSVGLSIYFIASNVIGIIQAVLMGTANFRNIFSFGPRRPPQTIPATVTAPVRRETPKPPTKNGGTSRPAKPTGGGKSRR
jgi:YidC/Oxa1 family membrane protein insertase